MSRSEQRSCADELALLLSVHGQRRRRERRIVAVAHFDEDQRASVKHHYVDFASTTTEVPRHGLQAPFEEISICGVLGSPA